MATGLYVGIADEGFVAGLDGFSEFLKRLQLLFDSWHRLFGDFFQ
jgi:hypothetical protein